MKILHVTDCMNGGVNASIIDLTVYNQDDEHFLLWRSKSDSPKPDLQVLQDLFQSTYILKRSLIISIFQLLKLSNKLRPDVIHLHSSKAGLIGRLLPQKCRIFYSSHGFAFQKLDVPKPVRFFFYQLERLLRKNTDTYVAFWPLDFELANSKIAYRKVTFYESEILRSFPKRASADSKSNKKLFVTSARIARAKDPGFLINAIALLKFALGLNFQISNFPQFVWVGFFDSQNRNSKILLQMEEVGIKLISWKKNKELLDYISNAEATIITSAWESGPMTFYESLKAGTPVLIRDIPAVSMFNFSKYQTPENLTIGILNHLNDPTFRNSALVEQITEVNRFLAKMNLITKVYA